VTYIDSEPHYRRPDGRFERIWFPDGPPAQTATAYIEEPDEVYAAVGAVAVEEAYRFLAETGRFKDGMLPEVASRRGWVRFDL